MAHVNLLKQFKTGNGWVLKSIPRKPNGQRDWSALPDSPTRVLLLVLRLSVASDLYFSLLNQTAQQRTLRRA
jgi:hypothetical protein